MHLEWNNHIRRHTAEETFNGTISVESGLCCNNLCSSTSNQAPMVKSNPFQSGSFYTKQYWHLVHSTLMGLSNEEIKDADTQ